MHPYNVSKKCYLLLSYDKFDVDTYTEIFFFKTCVPRKEAAQLKKTAHTSYSFEELSHMSVKSAPRHQGPFYKPQLYENIPIVEACQGQNLNLSVITC